jgi:hypothetical protein
VVYTNIAGCPRGAPKMSRGATVFSYTPGASGAPSADAKYRSQLPPPSGRLTVKRNWLRGNGWKDGGVDT